MNELITGDNERIVSFICSLDRILEEVRRFTETNRPVLNGERFLTDKELASKLKVSRRTLQDYRNEGRIPYIFHGLHLVQFPFLVNDRMALRTSQEKT